MMNEKFAIELANLGYEIYILDEDELEHHGIKGMRWGIRRQRGPDGRIIPGKLATGAKAAAKAPGKALSAILDRRKQTYTNAPITGKGSANKKYEVKAKSVNFTLLRQSMPSDLPPHALASAKAITEHFVNNNRNIEVKSIREYEKSPFFGIWKEVK